jgi:hypothetical protein
MTWEIDWVFGVPMLVGITVMHISALVLVAYSLIVFERRRNAPRSFFFFLLACIYVATVIIVLHGLESYGWALLYVFLGAIPNWRDALLYSLNAFTAYGHEPIMLESKWKLLGAIEAMNGLLIFGITTAFLFAVLSELRPVRITKREI